MAEFEKAPIKITEDMRRALRQMADGPWTNKLDKGTQYHIPDDMKEALQTMPAREFDNHIEASEDGFFTALRAQELPEGNTNEGSNQ